MTNISELIGKTLVQIDRSEEPEELLFITSDGITYKMYHMQDGCESVYLEYVIKFEYLINSPILVAQEVTNIKLQHKGNWEPESYTWTFYELSTIKGSVQLRWYGSSNGCCSEKVNFVKLTN